MHFEIQGGGQMYAKVLIMSCKILMRDPFSERSNSLPPKPFNLFAFSDSMTSVFPFLRLMISTFSWNHSRRLFKSSVRLFWITPKLLKDGDVLATDRCAYRWPCTHMYKCHVFSLFVNCCKHLRPSYLPVAMTLVPSQLGPSLPLTTGVASFPTIRGE